MADVFISYEHKDQAYARKLRDSLRQRGFDVWMDEHLESGDRWWQTIVQAIRASTAFVIVMTPDSESSEWVEREILLAQQEGKPIFPLLLRGHGIPLLVTTQYTDVTNGQMPPDNFYERLEREVRVQPEEEILEAPEPARVRKQRAWRWPLVGLLVLIGVVVVGVFLIGLMVGGGRPDPTPTTSVPVAAEGPTHTPRPAAATSTSAPVLEPQPEPTSTSEREATDTPVPEVTDTPVPPTDTPVPASSLPTSDASLHDTWTRPADGMEMVYVPSGTFEMGSADGQDDEQPVHTVTLDSFWIDKTEVTNDQFERFVQATSYRTDAEKEGTSLVYSDGSWSEVDGADWQHPNGPETSISDRMDHPVVQVSWNDATTYCQWAGGRLPTEAEWEYAARGPDGHIYPWGDTFDGTRVNFCDTNCLRDWKDESYDDGYERTAPVGNYPSGASWVGAEDMAGNVWEWVNDWYDGDYYASSPPQDPTGPETDGSKVLRGGSWYADGGYVRAATRIFLHPGYRSSDIGFRCVAVPGN